MQAIQRARSRTTHFFLAITRPALLSTAIAFVFELIICISLSTRGIQAFAYYLSQSQNVAVITQTMWKVSQLAPLTSFLAFLC